VRIRIALTTALAVSAFLVGLFTLANSPHAAAGVHHAAQPQHSTLIGTTLASFAAPIAVLTKSGPEVELAGTTATPQDLPVPPPPVPVTDGDSVYTADWMCIRIHESGNRYNDPAEPSGAYGILVSTWHDFGYSGWPYQAPAMVQDHLALLLYSLYGFHPWSSRFACGL
jgi:hypothetical protein